MNELLFRQLERMLKESRYESSCHNLKDLEHKVLSLSEDQLFEATQCMYVKGPRGYIPSFNFPNITFTVLEKGDVNSRVFQSVKNRIIFWENYANERPNVDEERTFLQVILARDSELDKSEVEKIISLAMVSKGTSKFEARKEMIISQYGKACDNTILLKDSLGGGYSDELYKHCVKETMEYFKANEGFCITEKNATRINDLKFLVLKHHNFESMLFSLVYKFFATDCIYQAFLDEIVLSISLRLESYGLDYDFLEDIIKDRFEIYGELEYCGDRDERDLIRDIITLEKIVNIRPYPYNSITF